jgi:hypothetical protein
MLQSRTPQSVHPPPVTAFDSLRRSVKNDDGWREQLPRESVGAGRRWTQSGRLQHKRGPRHPRALPARHETFPQDDRSTTRYVWGQPSLHNNAHNWAKGARENRIPKVKARPASSSRYDIHPPSAGVKVVYRSIGFMIPLHRATPAAIIRRSVQFRHHSLLDTVPVSGNLSVPNSLDGAIATRGVQGPSEGRRKKDDCTAGEGAGKELETLGLGP